MIDVPSENALDDSGAFTVEGSSSRLECHYNATNAATGTLTDSLKFGARVQV